MKYVTRERCQHTLQSLKELIQLAIHSVTRTQILQVRIDIYSIIMLAICISFSLCWNLYYESLKQLIVRSLQKE